MDLDRKIRREMPGGNNSFAIDPEMVSGSILPLGNVGGFVEAGGRGSDGKSNEGGRTTKISVVVAPEDGDLLIVNGPYNKNLVSSHNNAIGNGVEKKTKK